METTDFAEIEAELMERIRGMVWCNLATVGPDRRPRSRIVQPLWAGATAWIGSRRHGLKSDHITSNPAVSLAYIGDNIAPVYVDGTVAWADDADTRRYVWELARTMPEPLRFDFAPLYGSADNPAFGALKLTPRRIELANMMGQRRIWRAA